MNKKDNVYGQKYRKLRVLHHISLVNAAKNVTNKSTLAEWEKGKDNLSWCKVIQLLFNIHIQPIEFLEDSVSSQLYGAITNIAVAYRRNDMQQLIIIFKENLKKYEGDTKSKDYMFQAAIAANFYEDLSEHNVCPSILKDKIILYFSNIIDNKNFWCYEDIFYFGLITQLLDARHLHGFSLKLLEYIEKNPIDSKVWNELAINALLNADFSLMKKDLKKAEELYNRLDILEAIDNYAELIIRKKFLESLIQYLKNNSDVRDLFFISLPRFFRFN